MAWETVSRVDDEEKKPSGSGWQTVAVVEDPSDPRSADGDVNLLEDFVKPWWEEYDFMEDTVRPTKHALKGIPKGLIEIGDAPHYLQKASRYGQEKLIGEENVQAIEDTIGFMPGSVQIPKLTETLETNFPRTYQAIAGSEYGPGEEVPGWAQTGRVAGEWGSAGPVNAARKGTLKAASPDFWQGLFAGGGNVLDQAIESGGGYDGNYGELGGGLFGILLSLRKGDVTKLSNDDRLAWEFLVENMEEGRTVDDLLAEVGARLASEEKGSLAEIARDRGMADVQTALTANDADYARKLQRETEKRDSQILGGVDAQFEDFDEYIPDDLSGAAQNRIELADQQIKTEAELAAEAQQVPALEIAETEAERAFKKALEEQEAARLERVGVEESLPQLRAENTLETVGPQQREAVFGEVDRNDPVALYDAEKRYWGSNDDALDEGARAFEEVKNSRQDFTLGPEFRQMIERAANDPQALAALKNWMNDAGYRIANVKGIEFDPEAYDNILDMIEGENLSGPQILALRNFFASNANTGSNFVTTSGNRRIADAFDEVIVDTLNKQDPALGQQFIETKIAYPKHLQNKKLMESPTVVRERGEYMPDQQITAGASTGYPLRLEENITAYQQLKATGEAEKAAKAAVQIQQQVLNEATRSAQKAAKEAQKAIDAGRTPAEGLAKRRLENFADNPVHHVQGLIKGTGAAKTNELLELKTLMDEVGAGREFNALVGEALVDILDASQSGTRASALPKSTRDFKRYLDRLLKSDIVDAESAQQIAEYIERATVKEYLSGGRASAFNKMEITELQRLLSSIGAAGALRMVASGSDSLILANAFQRMMRRIVSAQSQGHSIEKLRELTLNPQRFVDIAQEVRSEDEMLRLMLTEIVGATQAAELMEEE